MQKNRLLSPSELNELKNFIKENAAHIYEYINTEILKNIGIMNPNYFIKIIQDIFTKNESIYLNESTSKINILPYNIFTLLAENGRVDYTSFRIETMDFKQINKEASTYYNYVQFSIKDDLFIIELKQSKIGGMPIDADFVKFSKKSIY